MGEVVRLEKQNRADFSEFWSLYPKRVARREAEKSWARLSEEEKERAIEAISVHVRAWANEGRDALFIPHASTWLNQGRFDDELEVVMPKVVKCRWSGCEATGRLKHGTADYCQKHFDAVKRGETPGR